MRADRTACFGGPFLVLNIPSAHFLWLLTALLLHLFARWLGGEGRLRQTLQVTGIGLFSYLLIGLLNYLHLFAALPSVTLHASDFYRPNLGIGQLIVLTWMVLLCYHIGRQVYGLSTLSGILVAPLPVALSLLLYMGSAALFFNLIAVLPGRPAPTEWLGLANWAYLAAVLALSALIGLWARRRLKAGEPS